MRRDPRVCAPCDATGDKNLLLGQSGAPIWAIKGVILCAGWYNELAGESKGPECLILLAGRGEYRPGR